MPEHQLIVLTVIVNGVPTDVAVEEQDPLEVIVVRALDQTGNHGQPPSNWELRNAAGQVLDVNKTVRDYGFETGTRLFLNLKAGVGGDVGPVH
jgi:hypothetical protein